MSATMSPSLGVPPRRHELGARWRVALAALLFALVALLILYRDTAIAMATIWFRSDTFAHALLVPPIVLWLLWRQRERLAAITPRANPWVLLPIAAAALVWLLGDLAAVNAVAQLAFTALLVLAVPAVLGLQVARAAVFPLAFLFFAVPIGEFLLPDLMQLTADFTVAALRLSGVPVFREGLIFVIPSGNWSVVEACSGVRYLIASFMVGTLYAYLTYRSMRRRLIFIGVSLLLPLLANWIRAYLIVMLGHLSNNRIATGVDHVVYGWVFFGVVLFMLFVAGGRWAESPAPAPVPGPAQQAEPSRARVDAWIIALVATALVLLTAVPPFMQQEIAEREPATGPSLAAPATLSRGWQTSPDPISDWQAKLANPSAEIDAVYVHDSLAPVGLRLAYYRHQGYERKLGDSGTLLTRSDDWRWVRVAEGRRVVAIEGRPVAVRTARLHRFADPGTQQSALVPWQLYWVNGSLTTSDAAAKALVALNRLLGRGDDAAVIIVYTRSAAPGIAEQTLETFLQQNLKAIEAMLQQARSQR